MKLQRLKNGLACFLIGALTLVAAAPLTRAQSEETFSLTDLQTNLDYVFPDPSYLTGLEYHSTWREVERTSMVEASGVEVTYEAILTQSPDYYGELPTINAYLMPRASERSAQEYFNIWNKSTNFDDGTWTKLTEGTDYFSYTSESGTESDIIKDRVLEEASLHLVTYYENVVIIVNFYRPSGEYNNTNVTAYLEYLEEYEETLAVLNELVIFAEEAMLFYISGDTGYTGPTDYEYYPVVPEFYLDLTDVVDIPRNGFLNFEIYLDEGTEVGTIFNTTGNDLPTSGDMIVELNQNAIVEVHYYAPEFTSTCGGADGWDTGWHHLYSSALDYYSWERVTIGYGSREPLTVTVDLEEQDLCEVYAPLSVKPVYLGDYPDDETSESVVAYLKGITDTYATDDDTGERLDELMYSMIFDDVSWAHRYADAIDYMWDQHMIDGYEDGTFRPEQFVNRVEILKMLLLGFEYDVPDNDEDDLYTDLGANQWYLKYVNYASELGIVGGYPDGSYKPANSMNRVEFLKILLNAYGVDVSDYPVGTQYPDTDANAWYAPYVQYSKDNALMDLDHNGNFNPANTVSRGEVAETIYRLVQ